MIRKCSSNEILHVSRSETFYSNVHFPFTQHSSFNIEHKNTFPKVHLLSQYMLLVTYLCRKIGNFVLG